MIWIDFVIIGLLVTTWLVGLLKGISQQLYSIVCWLIAFLVGMNFCKELAFFLKPMTSYPAAQLAVAFVLLCLVTIAVAWLIRLLLGNTIKKSGLTLTERIGGMVIGITHGLLYVLILVMLAGLSVLPHDSPWWKKSKLIPPFQLVVVWLRDHVPSALTKNVHYH